MSFAETVRLGDPDRYLAAMAAKPDAREKLLVLYAFNLEIARAPWASAEPMIAEMRLQWWLDAIGDIFEGRGARGHEVLAPLAALIDAHNLPREVFDNMINARQFDIYREPHADRAAFDHYVMATSGGIMGLAARVLGGDALAVKHIAYGAGVANLLRAAPELIVRGCKPLPQDIAPVIDTALAGLAVPVAKTVFSAALAGWRARAVLQAARKKPEHIAAGLLEESPAWRRFSFMRCRITGRF
ncbi:MAG: squalene/phytoene synthase family protein [Rhodobacteraceae bacterium]|nr:squalene/phytoene synthase family protein [Paracoccaceae bacterium]